MNKLTISYTTYFWSLWPLQLLLVSCAVYRAEPIFPDWSPIFLQHGRSFQKKSHFLSHRSYQSWNSLPKLGRKQAFWGLSRDAREGPPHKAMLEWPVLAEDSAPTKHTGLMKPESSEGVAMTVQTGVKGSKQPPPKSHSEVSTSPILDKPLTISPTSLLFSVSTESSPCFLLCPQKGKARFLPWLRRAVCVPDVLQLCTCLIPSG